MLRKRNVVSGLSIINGIGDGIPDLNNKKKQDLPGNTFKREKNVEIEIVPNKTRESFAKSADITEMVEMGLAGFDGEEEEEDINGKPNLTIYDLSLKQQLYSTNLFAFLCSIGM